MTRTNDSSGESIEAQAHGWIQRVVDEEDTYNATEHAEIKKQADKWLWQVICDGDVYIQSAEGYAEPGYGEDGEKGILFANWNSESRWNRETQKSEHINNTMPELLTLAEHLGYECEWEGEWQICECNNAFRISPDSHYWTQYGAIVNGECICGDCIVDDPEDYLEELYGDCNKAITFPIDLESHGFVDLNEVSKENSFESGLYGGQDASPDKIGKALESNGITDFIFKIDSVGQFDARFSVWVKQEDLQAAKQAVFENDSYHADMDPATAMRQGLQAASKAMADLPNTAGVKYAKVNSDGTADVRVVPPQEFIEGIRK